MPSFDDTPNRDQRDSVNDYLADSKVPLDQEPSSTPSSYDDILAEKRIVRRLDWRILPITCLMYLAAFLDRSNLGNARTLPEGIDSVLGSHGDPTGVLFDWVNSIFFFSYILVQVPAQITAKTLPPRIFLGLAGIGFATCSTLMATGFNFAGLMVCRLFLGVFEAAFAPGVVIYFSLFYTRNEMALRIAYFFGFAAVAGACGGLIAFGVAHIHSTVAQWRLLFIIEGIPAIFVGLAGLLFLPNRPEMTTFFSEEERKIALRRRTRGTSGDIGYTINRRHIVETFMDWRVYVGSVMYFAANAALASISAFLPTILVTLGYTDAVANAMTVPPYAVAALLMTTSAWLSDRVQMRGPFVAAWSAVAAIGYLLLLTVADNNRVRYFAVFCIVGGTYTIVGIIVAWFTHNLGSDTKRYTGTPLYIAIGQGGSILGSHLFPKTEGPRYIKAFGVLCGLMFLSTILSLSLSLWYKLENDRRDRAHGFVTKDEPVDTSELADRAPTFRYTP